MNPYRIWRRQLTELQLKIDSFDDNFDWNPDQKSGESGEDVYKRYHTQRKPLLDELESHYAQEGNAIDATEK